MQTQLSDVIIPAEFTAYQFETSLVSTALFMFGAVRAVLLHVSEAR